MKKLILTLNLLFVLSFGFAHKTYVSIANMEYNPELTQIEVSLKLTAHDFEHVLENTFKKTYHIENVADSSEVGQYIQNYLKRHITVYSNEKQADFNYVGKEVTVRDELFFYFTFTKVADPKTIKVSNTILFELFTKQQNIIHYKYQNKTKSVTLITSKNEETISHS
ncbi:MAG: DUF6702 family protein [Putridiphycobacter sp.]